MALQSYMTNLPGVAPGPAPGDKIAWMVTMTTVHTHKYIWLCNNANEWDVMMITNINQSVWHSRHSLTNTGLWQTCVLQDLCTQQFGIQWRNQMIWTNAILIKCYTDMLLRKEENICRTH